MVLPRFLHILHAAVSRIITFTLHLVDPNVLYYFAIANTLRSSIPQRSSRSRSPLTAQPLQASKSFYMACKRVMLTNLHRSVRKYLWLLNAMDKLTAVVIHISAQSYTYMYSLKFFYWSRISLTVNRRPKVEGFGRNRIFNHSYSHFSTDSQAQSAITMPFTVEEVKQSEFIHASPHNHLARQNLYQYLSRALSMVSFFFNSPDFLMPDY
jgi:hypothetical protein